MRVGGEDAGKWIGHEEARTLRGGGGFHGNAPTKTNLELNRP
jgi:hypothetical protein